MEGFLRVYFPDNSWTTIALTKETSVDKICRTICTKRQMPNDNTFALFISDSNANHEFERKLDPEELPFEIQDVVRKHGQLENFRFVFKPANSLLMEDNARSSGSDDDEEIFSQTTSLEDSDLSGYLLKRGVVNTQWRLRWFVLKGSKLMYFKDKGSSSPKSYIPVENAVIKENPHNATDEYKFEIFLPSKERVFYLAAKSHASMVAWISALRNRSLVEHENAVIDEIQAFTEEVEYAAAVVHQQNEEKLYSLEGFMMMKNKALRDQLLKFLEKSHCEENFLFCEGATFYAKKKNLSPDKRLVAALDIYNSYVKRGSPHEVALESSVRNQIETAIRDGEVSLELFEPARTVVFNLLSASYFREFVKTKQFQKCLLLAQPSKDEILRLIPDYPALDGTTTTNVANESPGTHSNTFTVAISPPNSPARSPLPERLGYSLGAVGMSVGPKSLYQTDDFHAKASALLFSPQESSEDFLNSSVAEEEEEESKPDERPEPSLSQNPVFGNKMEVSVTFGQRTTTTPSRSALKSPTKSKSPARKLAFEKVSTRQRGAGTKTDNASPRAGLSISFQQTNTTTNTKAKPTSPRQEPSARKKKWAVSRTIFDDDGDEDEDDGRLDLGLQGSYGFTAKRAMFEANDAFDKEESLEDVLSDLGKDTKKSLVQLTDEEALF